jgi:hypothetical protein
MANTIITISDGTVTKTLTVTQAIWDKVAEAWVRDGTALADTAAEFTYWGTKVQKELQNLANKEIGIAASQAATKITIGDVS